jgi:uncharacterized protein YlxW (UPF0749 family)
MEYQNIDNQKVLSVNIETNNTDKAISSMTQLQNKTSDYSNVLNELDRNQNEYNKTLENTINQQSKFAKKSLVGSIKEIVNFGNSLQEVNTKD